MRKNILYNQMSDSQKRIALSNLKKELSDCKDFNLLDLAWESFSKNDFSYDGPTFGPSRFKNRWELASFIHDWRNGNGYVGYSIDKEFIDIMIKFNYPSKIIILRWFLTRLTFLNIIRHMIKGTFKKSKPTNLYIL